MTHRSRTITPVALIAAACLLLSGVAHSHLDEDQIAQSYRQSWFAMVGVNFGPVVSMLKGEMPWNDEAMKGFTNELAILASMDLSRSFADGTDKGTTRAKPEIWGNKDDFMQKMDDLTVAINALQSAAAGATRKPLVLRSAPSAKPARRVTTSTSQKTTCTDLARRVRTPRATGASPHPAPPRVPWRPRGCAASVPALHRYPAGPPAPSTACSLADIAAL